MDYRMGKEMTRPIQQYGNAIVTPIATSKSAHTSKDVVIVTNGLYIKRFKGLNAYVEACEYAKEIG